MKIRRMDMAVTEELIPDLLVVKRDGKKVEFNG